MELTQELTRIYGPRAFWWFGFGLCVGLLSGWGFEWVFFWSCFWIWLYVLNGLVDRMEGRARVGVAAMVAAAAGFWERSSAQRGHRDLAHLQLVGCGPQDSMNSSLASATAPPAAP